MSLECTATLLLDDQPGALVAEQLTRAVVENYAPPGAVADYLAQEVGTATKGGRLRWWVGSTTRRLAAVRRRPLG